MLEAAKSAAHGSPTKGKFLHCQPQSFLFTADKFPFRRGPVVDIILSSLPARAVSHKLTDGTFRVTSRDRKEKIKYVHRDPISRLNCQPVPG